MWPTLSDRKACAIVCLGDTGRHGNKGAEIVVASLASVFVTSVEGATACIFWCRRTMQHGVLADQRARMDCAAEAVQERDRPFVFLTSVGAHLHKGGAHQLLLRDRFWAWRRSADPPSLLFHGHWAPSSAQPGPVVLPTFLHLKRCPMIRQKTSAVGADQFMAEGKAHMGTAAGNIVRIRLWPLHSRFWKPVTASCSVSGVVPTSSRSVFPISGTVLINDTSFSPGRLGTNSRT